MVTCLHVEEISAQGNRQSSKVAAAKDANKDAITQEWLSMPFPDLVKAPVEQFAEDTRCIVNLVARLTESSGMKATLKGIVPILDLYDRTKDRSSSITVDLLWSNAAPTTNAYSLQSIAVNTSYVDPGLFPAEALKAFRDSVEAHKKEQGITQKSQLTVHRTIISALDRLKKRFAGIQLQVFEGGRQIARGDFVLIADAPAMPKIRVKPVSNDTASGKKVELRLEIAYQRDGEEIESKGSGKIPNVRNDYNTYPSDGRWESVSPSEEWSVDFGEDMRGGTAMLLSRYNGRVDTFRFYIRGENPTVATVKSYMNKYVNQYWFIKKITYTESAYRQFESGKKYSSAKLTGTDNASGEPLYGKPRGFGLKQLDNWGTASNPKYATKQHLWHWKENVEGGVEVIKEKKENVDKAKKKKGILFDENVS